MRIFLFISSLLVYQTAVCQDGVHTEREKPITYFSADRPGIGDTPDIIPNRQLFFETGPVYLKESGSAFFQLPATTFRYGLNNWLEARMDINYLYNGETENSGINTVSFGFKAGLFEFEKLGNLKTSLIAEAFPPKYLPGPTNARSTGVYIGTLHSYTIGVLNLYNNLILNWMDTNSEPAYQFLMGAGKTFMLFEKAAFSPFVEYFYSDIGGHRGAGGITLQYNRWIQYGFTASFSMDEPAENSFYDLSLVLVPGFLD